MEGLEQIILSQMKDVASLHSVSAWPLGLGWWIILGIIILIISSVSYYKFKKQRYRKSWKYKLELELDKISQNLTKENVKETVSEVNEILKRLAIQTYGREEVASKQGEKWLKWLTNRDPKGFSWVKKGQLLITYPYMPVEMAKGKKDEVYSLIKAIKNWVK